MVLQDVSQVVPSQQLSFGRAQGVQQGSDFAKWLANALKQVKIEELTRELPKVETRMVDKKLISEPVFAFYLQEDMAEQGELVLGAFAHRIAPGQLGGRAGPL